LTKIPYTEKELLQLGPQPSYTERNLDDIAFPLGGIGTGSVSLGGWGQLRDWEIMNRPAKGFVIPRAFFAVKVRYGKKPSVVKVLQGPVGGSYAGDGHSLVSSYIRNDLGHGLPHFRKANFTGTFPFAKLELVDPDVPIRVTLEAFSPFMPLNDKDSSIPVAIFTYSFENTGTEEAVATVYGNLTNVIGDSEVDDRVNEVRKEDGAVGLFLTNKKIEVSSPRYGSMALATNCSNASVWPRWKDASLSKFWEAIALSDEFPLEGEGRSDTGTVAASFMARPGEKATVTFVLSWHFPNFEHYWGKKGEGGKAATWRNFYATIWKDAWDVVLYTTSNLRRLREETKRFHDTLFSSTLPVHVLDAVSSQLSTLRTTTCLRLEDGTFYGFEGSSNTGGCCEGSCTHVWNYAQAVPYLFPNLQRSMLNAHFANSVQEDGFMTFRMPLPLGTKAEPSFHPAADGQMGLILQVYHEWLISGDNEWLRSICPTVKKLLEFAWKYWDADKDGIMEGMQHNTYDIEFYGPNTVTGSLYLAALRAAEEMAKHLDEYEKAQEYRKLFVKGSSWADENLFNGQYYEQKVNPAAYEIWPEPYRTLTLSHGRDDKFADWPKWQFGKGCVSDQMIGQWYAHMIGLGYLYSRTNIHKTLQSIFRHNWKPQMWNHPCLLRIYAVNEEAGLVVCTWPKGERPGYALYYADEVWCGIEYQVASHMIYEGMVKEGLALVFGTRNRHRGDRRNPWNEFECGHHYARSMASYALLLALSGFKCSAPERRLGFTPKIYRKNFRCFFSSGSGWGLYKQRISQQRATFTLELRYGSLPLSRWDIPLVGFMNPVVKVTLNRKKIKANIKREKRGFMVLLESTLLKPGQVLKVSLRQE